MRTSELRRTLSGLVPGIVSWEREIIDFYSVDSSSYVIRPKAVVFPADEKDVQKIVRFAGKSGTGITARGGGTGLVGGGIGDGIIMDLKAMNRTSVHDGFVSAEAGASKGALDAALERRGKIFGPNPSVGPYCTIGGMIGTNAGGSRSLKYGTVIDNILEVEFVDGCGNLIRLPGSSQTGRKIARIARGTDGRRYPDVSKNSCGYRLDAVSGTDDVQKIMAGSEGTLGIITSAKLKIHPRPRHRTLAVFGYKSIGEAMGDCMRITRMRPAALEFIDCNTLGNIKYGIPKKTRCALFIEFEGQNNRHPGRFLSGSLLKSASDEREIKRWWRYRDSALAYSMRGVPKSEIIPHIIEDAAVPIRNLGRLARVIGGIGRRFGARCIVYGHAGDGNLHVRLVARDLGGIAEWYFARILELGGTITAEHGDGLARTGFVRQQYGDDVYRRFRQLKGLLDPHGILNPEKIMQKGRNAGAGPDLSG